jgi:putative NADH-flavin reductase
MKIALLGATGKTGQHVLKQALTPFVMQGDVADFMRKVLESTEFSNTAAGIAN